MPSDALKEFHAPYDWDVMQDEIMTVGGVIAKGLFSHDDVNRFNAEIAEYLSQNEGAGLPTSGSDGYDRFLGHRTIRLHGLVTKSNMATEWLDDDALVTWARRTIEPIATSVLMNAGEFIQIGPGEPRQFLHRDSDSWPMAPIGGTPIIVNAMVALDPFTKENGATRVVPGSAHWDPERRATPEEIVQAVMSPGDAFLFRGDTLHGGGANQTDTPRRGVSITYCAGWLRTVESSQFNVPLERAQQLSPRLQNLLGFHAYDGSDHEGGLLGLYENGDPKVLVQ